MGGYCVLCCVIVVTRNIAKVGGIYTAIAVSSVSNFSNMVCMMKYEYFILAPSG